MKHIPIKPKYKKVFTPLESFIVRRLNLMLSEYREEQEDADRTETTKYAGIINKLETLLSEIVHFE